MRDSATQLPDFCRPLRLPHLEIGPGSALFLGEPVAATQWSGDTDAELWRRCDGTVPLSAFGTVERDRITAWHAAGLLVAVGLGAGRARDVTPVTVVSPHPDDAALAVGGLLATCGGTVLDVFTYETFTHRGYYKQRPEQTAALLCEEEAVACRVLDVDHVLLGHHDAVLRPAWADGFMVADEDATASPAQLEPELFARVTDDLVAHLPQDDPVLTPLGVGGHVDHLLARDATIAAFGVRGLDPGRLRFYEDMPYSLFGDPTAAGPSGSVLLPADDAAAAVKREALRAYRIQVPVGMADRVVRYGRRSLGRPAEDGSGFVERVWTTAARPEDR